LTHRLKFRLNFTQFGQQFDRPFGFVFINPTHGKSHVNQDPIPETRNRGMILIDNAGDIHLSSNTSDFHDSELMFDIADFNNLPGYA
jgi:hypothetical protein